MNRCYKNYEGVEPYTNGWGHKPHSGTGYSDHVHRPVTVDADGRQHPVMQYANGTEGYVVKAERIVEHITRTCPVVSLVTNYRYSTDEPLADHSRHGQLSQAYDRPKKVEDFLTKVQDEAGRPATKGSGPYSSNWRTRPNSAGKDHGIGSKNYADDCNDFQDKESDAYPKFHKEIYPAINNKDMYYDRPNGNHGPIAPSPPLSKPTNDIGTAVDFLTEAIKPNYVTSAQTDHVTRPNKASPLSPIPWRLAGQDRKPDSGEDNWGKPQEQPIYGKEKHANFRGPTYQVKTEGYDRPVNGHVSTAHFGRPDPFPAPPQPTRFAVPTTQHRETYSAPEPTIDSIEARKRYGHLKNQSLPENAYAGTIDSEIAVKKYNGAKVPW